MDKEARSLLLNGYVREIKLLLADQTIIPHEIISLCSLFYASSRKIFVQLMKDDSLNIFDLESKTMSKLMEHKPMESSISKHKSQTKGFVYIENISRYLPMKNINQSSMDIDPNKSYHGIICIDKKEVQLSHRRSSFLHYAPYPSILLIESNKINDKAVYYHKFVTNSRFDVAYNVVASYIFCGKDHGIICSSQKELYQCKLQNIDFTNLQIKYTKIKDNKFWESKIKGHELTMLYLPPNKIFVIQRPDVFWGMQYDAHSKDPVSRSKDLSLKCAIFDLNNKKWKEVSDFTCKRDAIYNGIFSRNRCICLDENRKNIVYAVGNKGDVSEYDLDNDEWKYWKMRRKLNLREDCVCWMDNYYSLCCSDGHWFGCIDIRSKDGNPEWVVMEDIQELADNIHLPSRRAIFL